MTPQPDEAEREGTYVSFVSFAGLELAFESLDVNRAGDQPELVAVQAMETADGMVQVATVYIPDGKKQYLLDKLNRYVATADEDRARNAALVEGTAAIRRATIQELWTDPPEEFPADPDEMRWWEVWLRGRDGRERTRFRDYATSHDLRTSEHYLGFGDRTIALLRASARQLAETFSALDGPCRTSPTARGRCPAVRPPGKGAVRMGRRASQPAAPGRCRRARRVYPRHRRTGRSPASG